MPATDNLALLTDLYQLTMAQAYFQSQRLAPATFSLFVRSYPPNRELLRCRRPARRPGVPRAIQN